MQRLAVSPARPSRHVVLLVDVGEPVRRRKVAADGGKTTGNNNGQSEGEEKCPADVKFVFAVRDADKWPAPAPWRL